MAPAFGVFMILAGAIHAQTLTDLGSTVPTPGANDIAQLSTVGNQTAPDGLNYYTDDAVNGSGNGEPGQTFNTGSLAVGYTVTSLAIKTAGLGSYSGIGTSQDYDLHFYSVSGGIATLIKTYTGGPITFNDGDWLQWSNLSVALAPNATYAYSFGRINSGVGWEALAVSSANPYADGEIGLVPVTGGSIVFGASHDFDAVFDLGLTVPLSAVANIPSISPTNDPVYAGTPVTLTEAASGQPPLSYQWQTDGGSGGLLTNIGGAVSTYWNVGTASLKPGTYLYDVVVSNSFGVSTSGVATLNLVAAAAPVLVSDITPNPALSYSGGSMTFSAVFNRAHAHLLPVAGEHGRYDDKYSRGYELFAHPRKSSTRQFGNLFTARVQFAGRPGCNQPRASDGATSSLIRHRNDGGRPGWLLATQRDQQHCQWNSDGG